MKHLFVCLLARVTKLKSAKIVMGAAVAALLAASAAWAAPAPTPAPIVITGADRRPATSLNGDWSTIVDPYSNGFSGYARNQKAQPGDTRPTEYDFSKSPKLKVPGDWNTQRESLFYYEGPIWYERDFTYQPKEQTRIYLHVGAANYRSWFWVNGQKVCEHEGGFTSFNCDVTATVHAGANFVVAAVDNTRHEDGVPTLKTLGLADRGSRGLHRSI
jgi:beta-glucuronidase